jgi:hypothetical protein
MSNKISPDGQEGSNNDNLENKPVIEGEEEDEDHANKILDRSQLMDHMLFPENGPTLVIVPSNK